MSIIISVCFFFFGAPSKTPTMLTAVPRMLNLFVEREGGGGVPFRCGYFALSLRTVSLWRDQNCILCSRWNIMCLSEIDREARFNMPSQEWRVQ